MNKKNIKLIIKERFKRSFFIFVKNQLK